MDINPKTSRRLAKLLENLPPEDRQDYGRYVVNGGDRFLWLMRYELKQQVGNMKLKDK